MMKRILVVPEKHYTYYFDASTKELENDALLYLLNNRGVEQYNPYDSPTKTEITDDILKLIPKESAAYKAGRQELDIFEKSTKQYNNLTKIYGAAKKAKETQDAVLAAKVFWNGVHEGVEYDRVRHEEIVHVDFKKDK